VATLTMPQLGESVTEGTILRWLVAAGATIALDQPLVEIETEKVTVEIPSPFEGTLTAVLVAEGETVPVGTPLAEFHVPGEAAPPAGDAGAPAPADAAKRRYSPAVTRLAAEHGIDLGSLSGSGAGGRVTRQDVLAAVAAREEAAPAGTQDGDTVVSLSPTRRRIAEHMLESVRSAPHAWLLVECDASALVARRAADREAFRARAGIDLSYLPYIAHAVCRALREYPDLNASWSGDALVRRGAVDLGIAVDAPQGLVAPSVKDAGRLGVGELARAIADLTDRARERRLTLDDVGGGSFTLDNTGVFGTTATAPIINTPQVAILTTEAIIKRPVAGPDDTVVVRPMMNLCLSFDHRAMDGSTAARFTTRVRDLLQSIDEESAAR
jgi:2-oxoisovalerate dehydrogenase E2 component (dihydrolipoyl transacylase)